MEDIGGCILRLFAVSNAMSNVGVDSFKIVNVQLGKARRIVTGGLDLHSFVVVVPISEVLVFQRLQNALHCISFLLTPNP